MAYLVEKITEEATNTFTGKFYKDMPKDELNITWNLWVDHWFNTANKHLENAEKEGLTETAEYLRKEIQKHQSFMYKKD